MNEKYTIDTTSKGEVEVSLKSMNGISKESIAEAYDETELEKLLINSISDQDARKESWKLAYKDIPLPPRGIPTDTMRELSERRNELAENYFQKIKNGKIKVNI